MDTITLTNKVRNYQGKNNFILNLKEGLNKYGSLTQNQITAVEKFFPTKEVDIETLSDELKQIANYEGKITFINDIKSKVRLFGTITEKQKEAALNYIRKEIEKNKMLNVRIPTPGETIIIGRTAGQDLKERYNLRFNPILLDIVKVLGVSNKEVKFQCKMTIKRGDVCMCCARTLTDEFSMLTKLGKTCAGHMKIEYIKDASEAERLREDYLKRVEEIGLMELTVPKKQIKVWSSTITEKFVTKLIS